MLAVFPARGDTNRYAGSEFALVDAKPVMAAAAEITPEKYPDSDAVTVDQKSVRVYRADGTGECQDETFTKVLTEKGKRDNRTLTMNFMLPYTTVAVPTLEVIKPDGTVVPVDVAANSKESIDDSQMAENIYDPNMRVLQVNIPSLDIGDVIHSVERENIERPIIPGQYAEENVFEGTGFIRHITYEVHAPADRPLKRIVLRDEIPGTVTAAINPETNNTIVYRWEVNNVPRMFDEPSMPPYERGVATAFCEHPAGLGRRLEMVLELEPVASGRDDAGNATDQRDFNREPADGHGQDQGAVLFRLQQDSLHGHHAGKGPAGLRAARRVHHLRQKIRRLPRQGSPAGFDAAPGGFQCVSGACQRRDPQGRRGARPVFQPRHRRC